MSDEKYPEAAKVERNRDATQVIGEFLDWLTNEQGVVLCCWQDKAYYLDGEQISREEALALPRDGLEFFETPYEIGQQGFVPQRENTLDLLARFSGVDLEAYEAEKRQMLAELVEERA
jgi:hypothetical protein